jgi:hypothetical protein
MASTNQSPEFIAANKKYLQSQTDEERLLALEEMMKHMPKHKAGESMRANIRTRYKKLKQKIQTNKKKKKSGKHGIKKEGIQVVLVGLTNSGKSSLLSTLTNAEPKIDSYEFTTKSPVIGTLHYQGIQFQIIDMPAVNYEEFEQGITNTADILMIIITEISQISEILPFLEKAEGKKIICFNKSECLSSEQKRKISETLKTKKFSFSIISCITKENVEQLKSLLLENSGMIRVFTKSPEQKNPEKKPVILKPGSTVEQAAEKILKKGIKIKEVRVTGPSSKFPNQKVGLKHELKDKDIIEIHTI